MKDITDLTCWKNIVPSVYAFQYNTFINFILIVSEMSVNENLENTNKFHPFGFANLYVCGIYCSPENELSYVSDLVTEDKTIVFCMEIANAIMKEWLACGI